MSTDPAPPVALSEWLTEVLDASADNARFMERFHPGRALALIVALRAVIALHHPDRPLENWYWLERSCAECGHTWHKWLPDKRPTEIGPEQGCPTVRLLASAYADRPGYRDEWRP